MPMPSTWHTWQGKHAYCATFGKVSVLVYAVSYEQAIVKIAAIARQYNLAA